MAFWSCLVGYCEALATHKESSRRYKIFPIPIDALKRLVTTEFWSRVLVPAEIAAAAAVAADTSLPSSEAKARHAHRSRVQAVANAIWDTAGSSQKKDEEHANSLYVCLRGHIDRKSIDCLGVSVATVAGVKLLQQQAGNEPSKAVVTSMLALSEDHAYEKHIIRIAGEEEATVSTSAAATIGTTLEGTCEVAIPGATKRQKAKRGCEIAETFRDKKACILLTPETSWLYMGTNPVVCSTVPMSLVPIVANINCNIRSKHPGSTGGKIKASSLESRQLYHLKRELLWILYDLGATEAFPFGILELGDCEATVGSERGEEWAVSKSHLVEHGEPIMRNEELFLEAIGISRDRYNDAQVYPYYYAGHYHKDAGSIDPEHCNGRKDNSSNIIDGNVQMLYSDNEHRFADALKMYSEAARVTSRYRFDTGDCLQLNKHLTSVPPLIHEDILTTTPSKGNNTAATKKPQPRSPRKWIHGSNARACCFWLFRFLDHLLHWEEWSSEASSKAGITSKNPRFVEILQVSHKSFVGKLLQTFDVDVRNSALDDFLKGQKPKIDADDGAVGGGSSSSQAKEVNSFPVSKRLGSQAILLAKSLRAPKVQIRDMDLEIIDDDDNDDDDGGSGRRGRSSKRRRR